MKSALIQIDRTAPTTSIACNGGACSAGTYTAPVTVSLTATDNSGGSGVKATYYTTNGATPATSSTVYGGAFTISVTSTIRFFSVDNAGNSETARSQKVTIAGDPPAATSTVPVTGGGPGGSAPSTLRSGAGAQRAPDRAGHGTGALRALRNRNGLQGAAKGLRLVSMEGPAGGRPLHERILRIGRAASPMGTYQELPAAGAPRGRRLTRPPGPGSPRPEPCHCRCRRRRSHPRAGPSRRAGSSGCGLRKRRWGGPPRSPRH